MITIFTIPKKFDGHIAVIQKNAILSWKELRSVQIILFGNEQGVAEFAQTHQLQHIPIISQTQFETPLVSDAFDLAKSNAKHEILCYVNCDIIFTEALLKNIEFISRYFKSWLLVGRRVDLDITTEIDFSSDWNSLINERVKDEGILHSASGIDYFIFPKSIQLNMPNLVVGRPSWDNWLIYKFRSLQIPIIDSTKTNLVIHQNHPRLYKVFGPESMSNFYLAGGTFNLCSIRHSTYQTFYVNSFISVKKYFLGILRFNPVLRYFNSKKLDLVNIYLEKVKKV